MPRLHELQARFGTALVDAEADALGGHIRADGLTPQRRLGIYRKAREIHITTRQERYAQLDGNIYRKDATFRFRVLPQALKMWC